MTFSELGLSPKLLQAIADKNYLTPTPVQAAAIPAILRGQDVRACAQTGSGKTAAFAVPMLHKLITEPNSKAIILAPTRELAQQGDAEHALG